MIAIYENRGHAHGYRPMEELSGIRNAGLGKKQSTILPIENWEVKKISEGYAVMKQELKSKEGWEQIMLDQATIANLATLQIAGLEKPKWPAAWILQGKQGNAIYRTNLEFTSEMITEGKTMIEFGCVDGGIRNAGLGKKQSTILPIENWEVKKISEGYAVMKQELKSKEGWEQIMLDQATIANLATLQIAGLEKPKWPAAWILQGKQGNAIYRTNLEFTSEMITEGKTMIEFGCVDDAGTLWVNGKEVANHDAWDKPFVVNIAPYVHPGKNELAIVVRNNSGAGGLLKSVRLFNELKILRPLQWEVSRDLGGVVNGFTEGKTNGANWETVSLKIDGALPRKGNNIQPKGERDGLLTWYRVTFELPVRDKRIWIPWRVIINASGSGYMWVNGQNIGRYWEEGPQREFFLPECWLNFGGTNTLVIGLRQSESCGAVLNGVEIAPYYEDAEIRENCTLNEIKK